VKLYKLSYSCFIVDVGLADSCRMKTNSYSVALRNRPSHGVEDVLKSAGDGTSPLYSSPSAVNSQRYPALHPFSPWTNDDSNYYYL